MLSCLLLAGIYLCGPLVATVPEHAVAQTYGQVLWGQQQGTSTPNVVIFDGVQNVPIGQLNTTTHTWTPVLPSPLVLSGLTVSGVANLTTLNVSGVTTLSGQLIHPALPGLSTAVVYPSSFGAPPSFGLALTSAAAPWVIAATATSPGTDSNSGVFYTALTESQAGISVTISSSSPAIVTATGSNMAVGNVVSFEGTLGSPLVADATYYVCSAGLTANAFEISTTSNCAAPINTTGSSSGVTMATNKGLGGAEPSAYHTTVVNNGSIGNYIGSIGYISNKNKMASQPQGVASAVGAQGLGSCDVAGCSATWGGLMSVYDPSNVGGNPPHPQIGLEVDNYAQGPDGSQNRVGIQLAMNVFPPGGAGGTWGTGILIGSNGVVNNIVLANVTGAINGINLTGTAFSGNAFSSPGFAVQAIGDVIDRTATDGTFTIAQLLAIICTGGTNRGRHAFVSDTTATGANTYNGIVTGGGGSAVNAFAVCDGTNWRYQ